MIYTVNYQGKTLEFTTYGDAIRTAKEFIKFGLQNVTITTPYSVDSTKKIQSMYYSPKTSSGLDHQVSQIFGNHPEGQDQLT